MIGNQNVDRRQEVVAAHHEVDEAVEHHGEGVSPSWKAFVFNLQTRKVQEKHLTPVSLHDHKRGVEQVQYLGQVEHVQEICKT